MQRYMSSRKRVKFEYFLYCFNMLRKIWCCGYDYKPSCLPRLQYRLLRNTGGLYYNITKYFKGTKFRRNKKMRKLRGKFRNRKFRQMLMIPQHFVPLKKQVSYYMLHLHVNTVTTVYHDLELYVWQRDVCYISSTWNMDCNIRPWKTVIWLT